MSLEVALWIGGILIAALLSLLGIVRLALLHRIEHIEREIGTHETGLRGAAHRNSNKLTALEGRVLELEQRRIR